MQVNARRVAETLKRRPPDLVLASDDDAVREVVVPYLKHTATPVVFCGVNWSAEGYGLPVANVTGMLEVVPIRETLETMRRYYPTANGSIRGWQNDEAKAFVARTLRRPVVAGDDFIMPIAVYGQTKVAREQGEWAAQTALQIPGEPSRPIFR
ncbi:hypothetical protein GCM10023187_10490 [Nibrella viscosa]|uniref:Uncharacterized protein n=2 Tax=Nibrella viscosa TaxID=1084524 RepID=A0ABP8K1D3_9BACT